MIKMTKLSSLLLALCLAPSQATAQDHVASLFDKVLQASTAATCQDTQRALESITDDEITLALSAIKSQKIQGDASQYEEKINKIISQTSKCPDAQDAFVARMSKQTVALALKQQTENSPISDAQLAPVFKWLAEVRTALDGASCQDLSDRLAKLDIDTAKQAAQVMRAITPDRLSTKHKSDIQGQMRAIYKAIPNCPDAHAQIDKMIDGMFAR